MGALLWINGPFGGGKTHTAYELNRRLPGSVVCDPEHVGFGLHRMLPPRLRGDFQDLTAWRDGVREVLGLALRDHPGPVIAPMTLVDPGYFAEIIGRLRDDGHTVHHFALLAERATVLRRLSERGFGRGLKRESFAVAKLDHCLERLAEPEFAEHLATDRLTVPQVADRIAGSAGLSILPDTDSALRHRVRRTWTGIKHIRFD
ncbi:AAA family ATPase [Streptomyces sp. NBC_01221]|uniref:AAA family ATPase n=1 Tax=unclassified Streptomyces TaxID=2593676 RepID=UPI0022538806|nr:MULTISPECIES: AAA family ATPase [unclassified Streptomyces]MCX4787558.1 AAA family ATPase [Streptomyces sp. NBC_01221]MCX4796657.1 AAA family ATPase [Streptomyces sp. NBC_01242]WSJ37887.1 AAA family ATPase [Streptomyces sp. NBC_01321]